MDNVVHLLGGAEHAVLRVSRNLAQFRRSYDLRALEPVKAELSAMFGNAANAVLSQAIVLDRLLMRGGFAQDWLHPDDPRATEGELALLELVRCGQQSLFDLDRLVTAQFLCRRSDVVSAVCRYASMMLLAGLALPARGAGRASRAEDADFRLVAIRAPAPAPAANALS